MKKGKPKILTCLASMLFAAIALTFVEPAVATEIYTWKDENGVIHFSDLKPTGTDTRTIEIQDSQPPRLSSAGLDPDDEPSGEMGTRPQTAAQQRRQQIADERRAKRDERDRNEVVCMRHRERLAKMEPTTRVYFTNENGETVRMDDEERVSMMKESRDFIAENCN